jgi:cytidine diphosphoramidate kinase
VHVSQPVVWITGLAGSGKTTLARAVTAELRAAGGAVVHVDGDEVRRLFGGDLGYDARARLENAYRIARLCAFLQGEGVLVVCSTMSLYPEIWRFNRDQLKPYIQVYLDVPMSVLARRDQKGLYSGVELGTARNVGGIDLPLDLPFDSDFVLGNCEQRELERNAQTILGAIAASGAIRAQGRAGERA